MRSVLSLGVLLVFITTFSGPIMAQEAPIPDQIKKFEPIIGLWKNQEETRDSPASSWVKGSSDWELKWAVKGHCVQIDGKTSPGGSYIELLGYDPHSNTIIASGFYSDGGSSYFSSAGWDGKICNFNVSATSPDGAIRNIYKCAFVYTSDFKSFIGTCEQFTDGKWWVFRKVKGIKVK